MTRQYFLKSFRKTLYLVWASMILYIINPTKLTKILLVGFSIAYGILFLYAVYMILKYNPNFEDQRGKDDEDSE